MTTTNDSTYGQRTRRHLYRSADDRVIGGVCGGLADYFGIDPIILRILAGVGLLFSAGWLFFAYLVAWVLVPLAGERPRHGRGLLLLAAVIAIPLVLAIGAVTITGPPVLHDPGFGPRHFDPSPGPPLFLLWVPLVLVAIALFVRRDRHDRAYAGPRGPWDGPPPPVGGGHSDVAPSAATAAPEAASAETDVAPDGSTAAYEAPPGVPPWWAAREPERPWPARREPATLSWLTVSFALIVAGIATLGNVAGLTDFSVPAVLAAILLVVSAGLVLGAWVGNPRGLLPLAVGLAAVTVMTSATPGASAGERLWQPASTAAVEREYRLGFGEAILDLSRLEMAPGHEIAARVGFGRLIVLVHPDAIVSVRARAGAGSVDVLGLRDDGVDANLSASIPAPSGRTVDSSDEHLKLRLSVRLGSVEVRRAAA